MPPVFCWSGSRTAASRRSRSSSPPRWWRAAPPPRRRNRPTTHRAASAFNRSSCCWSSRPLPAPTEGAKVGPGCRCVDGVGHVDERCRTRMAWASRWARATSRVHTDAARPYSLSLARATASASSSKSSRRGPAEDLLACDAHAVPHAGEDGRPVEKSGPVGHRTAAGEQGAAGRDSAGGHPLAVSAIPSQALTAPTTTARPELDGTAARPAATSASAGDLALGGHGRPADRPEQAAGAAAGRRPGRPMHRDQ